MIHTNIFTFISLNIQLFLVLHEKIRSLTFDHRNIVEYTSGKTTFGLHVFVL